MTQDFSEKQSVEALKQKVQQLEKELSDSHGLLDAISSCVQISIIRTDSNGVITGFNSGAERMLGYKAEEVVGKHTPLTFHLDSEIKAREKELSAELGRLVRGFEVFTLKAFMGEREEQEWTYVRKDNTRLTVNLNVGVVMPEDGGPPYFVGVAQDITEKRKALAALKDSEGRLRTVIETIPDLIWLKDPEGVYITCNAKFEKFFGAKESEIAGKTDHDFVDKELADFFRRHDLAAIAAGKPTMNEEEITYADDGKRDVLETIKMPMFDSEESLVGVLGVARSIKERKRIEEELKAQKAFLDRVIDQSPFATWISDEKGVLQRANQALKKFLNLSDEQLVGRYNVLEDPLVEGQGLMPLIQSVFNQGKTISFEADWDGNDIPGLNLNGSNAVSIEATMFPVFDLKGNLTNLVLNWIDITKRKNAEKELESLRNYLANIIDSMPSILVGVDAEGKVTQWNKTAELETGIEENSAKGKNLSFLFPHLESEMENIHRSMEDCEAYTKSKRLRDVQGESRYEDLTVYPLKSDGVLGAVVRIDDVTNKIRMEQMIIQSEKMLSVGGLAAGMAHEINNPLAGITQTAHVLANRLGGNMNIPANRKAAEKAGTTLESIKEFMEARDIPLMTDAIIQSGHRVAEIVDNMLSFAQKRDDMACPESLSSLVDKTLDLAAADFDLSRHFDFKNIVLHREYEADLPLVKCENAKIQQVLLNILRNGAHAMQEHSKTDPEFILRLKHDRERNMVCMEIQDNGPGMDESVRKRAFEPFFTTKPEGVGTGLGLSVSYFIITENHGGEMEVESKPGKGAKFIIRLPLETDKG